MTSTRAPGAARTALPTTDLSTPPSPAYEPPRLTGKQPLERVTLFSFTCRPGDPTCQFGPP